MALFPGDMNIGWSFGLEPQEELNDDSPLYITPLGEAYMASCEAKESQPTDPLLAVSELEQRVDVLLQRSSLYELYDKRIGALEGMLKTYFAEAPSKRIFSLEQRVAHLENETLPDDTVTELEQRITDLEERLRSLVFVVNIVCSSMHDVMHQGKE